METLAFANKPTALKDFNSIKISENAGNGHYNGLQFGVAGKNSTGPHASNCLHSFARSMSRVPSAASEAIFRRSRIPMIEVTITVLPVAIGPTLRL